MGGGGSEVGGWEGVIAVFTRDDTSVTFLKVKVTGHLYEWRMV